MRKLFFVVLVFALGYMSALFVSQAIADASWLSDQTIFNRVFSSSTNTLTIIGQ